MRIRPDFPPLLSPGFHPKTLAEIRQMCVDAFPLSTRRKLIMDGLERFARTLVGHGVIGEIWLDGSFVTEKIDPDDADIVIEFAADTYEQGTDLTRALLEKINSDLESDRQYFKDHYYCDPYLIVVYPDSAPALHAETEVSRKYWIEHFGQDRRFRPKGMAKLVLR